jgi:UDP-galactopyranose mutase
MLHKRILVVGAGFAGATHARVLAEAGFEVDVIDRRPHLAGNAYDEADATGVRVLRYGPHLFHTSNARVVAWLQRFAAFVRYEHRVQAELPDGRSVPLPINRSTVNAVFGLRLADAAGMRDFLARQGAPHRRAGPPPHAAAFLQARIGTVLTDLFFRPYTRKMWGLELEELDASVVQRIPLRLDEEDRYFPAERFQVLPRAGYTRLFENLLDHPRIAVALNTGFAHAMLAGTAHCFNSMPIDEFFGARFGPLPYRSIRFHHLRRAAAAPAAPAATLNFTDAGPFTRETDWSLLPGHRVSPGPWRTVTREEPCDYLANRQERYYPVKTADGASEAAYRRYQALAAAHPGLSFIGRCGTYRYLDMHQVINQSLAQATAWIAAARTAA